jgi:hypothetical protein
MAYLSYISEGNQSQNLHKEKPEYHRNSILEAFTESE